MCKMSVHVARHCLLLSGNLYLLVATCRCRQYPEFASLSEKKILLQLSKLSRRQIYDSDDVSLVQGEQCLNIKRRHFVNSSNRPVLHILVCPPGRMVCECACFPFQRLLL